jgi:TonB family protein
MPRARNLRYALALLLLCFMGLTAAAADKSVEAALNSQYGGKTLALLHPIDKSSQVYDADGNVLKGGQEGSWTLFGRIFVKKIRVEKTSVLIEGQRLAYVQGRHDFSPVRSGGKLKVQINFTKAPSSADEANALLGHVFALTDEDAIKAAPRFWQKYLSAQLLHTPMTDSGVDPAGEKPKGLQIVEIDPAGVMRPEKIRVELSGHVTPPRALFTPEPEYTEAARHERYQGVVVLGIVIDSTGKVRAPNILRPLGMGLDDSAVSSILTWRFDPAKVDGKPVAVAMNIEVAFNLY